MVTVGISGVIAIPIAIVRAAVGLGAAQIVFAIAIAISGLVLVAI